MYAGATEHSKAAEQLLKRACKDESSSSQLAAIALDIFSDDCTSSESKPQMKLSQTGGSVVTR